MAHDLSQARAALAARLYRLDPRRPPVAGSALGAIAAARRVVHHTIAVIANRSIPGLPVRRIDHLAHEVLEGDVSDDDCERAPAAAAVVSFEVWGPHHSADFLFAKRRGRAS